MRSLKELRAERKCDECGESFMVSPYSDLQRFCSHPCYSVNRDTANKRGPIILRERARGRTWRQAALAAGISDAGQAQALAKKYARRKGTDIAWAFPGCGVRTVTPPPEYLAAE